LSKQQSETPDTNEFCKPLSKKKKVQKPFEIWMRWLPGSFGFRFYKPCEWHRHKSYATRELAELNLNKCRREFSTAEFEIREDKND
jgi:hypothetical protein